jgi:predicted nucleic acid-binding protein
MICVETGAWFATCVPNDPDHPAADAWLATNAEPLVTTDSVIDELLTLRKMRGEYPRALRLGASLFAGEIARLVWVMPDDVQEAWAIFQRYQQFPEACKSQHSSGIATCLFVNRHAKMCLL